LQTLLGHEGNNHLHAGFLGLLHVDHLSQMDGQRCHLVQKQANDYENALSPTHVSYSPLSLQFNLQPEEKNMSCIPNIKNLTNVACDFMRETKPADTNFSTERIQRSRAEFQVRDIH
jgi:hypothetical protein